MEQKEFVEESWSIKKISIAALALVLITAGGYFFYQGNKLPQESVAPIRQGQPITIPSSSNIEVQVKEQVNSLKKQVGSLNAVEVASSSPQVQKILNDIKDLEQYPHKQAKEACQKICSNF